MYRSSFHFLFHYPYIAQYTIVVMIPAMALILRHLAQYSFLWKLGLSAVLQLRISVTCACPGLHAAWSRQHISTFCANASDQVAEQKYASRCADLLSSQCCRKAASCIAARSSKPTCRLALGRPHILVAGLQRTFLDLSTALSRHAAGLDACCPPQRCILAHKAGGHLSDWAHPRGLQHEIELVEGAGARPPPVDSAVSAVVRGVRLCKPEGGCLVIRRGLGLDGLKGLRPFAFVSAWSCHPTNRACCR